MSDNVSPTAVSSATNGEQAEYVILWDDEMKLVNRYVRHKRVVVLMMYWENDPEWTDMSTEEEVNQLATILDERFHYQIEKRKISRTTRHVQQVINKYLSDFVCEHDGVDDALLIVYYAGHGWVEEGKRGILNMAGVTAPHMTLDDINRRGFQWNDSEHLLRKTDADVLVILDCCESGTLRFSERSRSQRLFEMLTACDAGESTRFPGPHSFTSALISALEGLEKEKRFNTCKLRQKIMEVPNFPENQHPMLYPRPFPASGPINEEHITLEICGGQQNEEQDTLGISREEMKVGGDYVDLRFHFKGTVSKEEITILASAMKQLLQRGELSLRRVGFVRKGNLTSLIETAKAAFLGPVNRRRLHKPSFGYRLTNLFKCLWRPFSRLLTFHTIQTLIGS